MAATGPGSIGSPESGNSNWLLSDAYYQLEKLSVGCRWDKRWHRLPRLGSENAEAEILADGPDRAAVRWRQLFGDEKHKVELVRTVLVRASSPVAFLQATLRNIGPEALDAVSCYNALSLADISKDAVVVNGEPLPPKSPSATPIETLSTGESIAFSRGAIRWSLQPDKNSHYAIARQWGSLQYLTIPVNLPLGGAKAFELQWLQSEAAPPSKWPAADWTSLSAHGRRVEPLALRDSPPADLPQTPLAKQYGGYGLSATWGPRTIFTVPTAEEYSSFAAAAGVRWYRSGGFGWVGVEDQRGQRDFTAPDLFVASARRYNLQIIGTFWGFPRWASSNGQLNGLPANLAQWGRYVSDVVKRYRGKVHVWEIESEPDCGTYFSGTVEDYAAILKEAYHAAKSADPDCLVMTSGFDGSGEAYLDRLLRLGAGNDCDLIGFHPYNSTPAECEARMRLVWKILNFHHVRKPVWATEVGFQVHGWKDGPDQTASEEEKAACLVECYRRLKPLTEVICWYSDVCPPGTFGLIEPGDGGGLVFQPAYDAYCHMTEQGEPQVAAARMSVHLETPDTIRAEAGKPCPIHVTLVNRTLQEIPCQLKVFGVDERCVELPPDRSPLLGPGTTRETTITLRLPAWQIPGNRSVQLAAVDPTGLRGSANLSLKIVNPGASAELLLQDGWVARVNDQGKHLGALRPRDEFAFYPGEAFGQGEEVQNLGSQTEKVRLAVSGPAAPWVTFTSKTELQVASNAKQWPQLMIRVPPRTAPGFYWFDVKATSATQAEVNATQRIEFDVIAAGAHPAADSLTPIIYGNVVSSTTLRAGSVILSPAARSAFNDSVATGNPSASTRWSSGA